MLSKILGIIGILTGLFWLIKPEALKNRIKKKINRKIKIIVFIFVIGFGLLLIGSIIRAEGFLPKFIGVIGIVITVKGILLLTSKTSEKILEWLQDRSLLFFRACALFIFVMGIMLMLV